MQVDSLYEMAVDLNPRAARIAAEFLAGDPALPDHVRAALRMALLRAATDEDVEGQGFSAGRDAQAAAVFVSACRKVYAGE
jgi:hypothetical protein